MNPLTIREICVKSEAYFREKGVDGARLSAQILVAHALGVDRMALFCDLDRPLCETELAAIRPLVARRGKGEPAALIIGEKEFYGRPFAVTAHTLVPRPETEMVVETALKRFAADCPVRFADLGTGTGILAVTLAAELAQSRGLALDISPEALDVARQNAVRHEVNTRLDFREADFAAIAGHPGSFELIVSNPPYVSEAEYAGLGREVRDFEPRGALVPGQSGLEAYRVIAPAAFAALAAGGALIVEIGCSQAASVTEILGQAGFADIAVSRDLAGLDRVVAARRPLC